MFYDVAVSASCFDQAQQVIRMNVLPPGKFFVPQEMNHGKTRLKRIPQTIYESHHIEPFTAAKDRAINEIAYSDGLGAKWLWRSKVGLSEVLAATS